MIKGLEKMVCKKRLSKLKSFSLREKNDCVRGNKYLKGFGKKGNNLLSASTVYKKQSNGLHLPLARFR